jgi:hypothetical protein
VTFGLRQVLCRGVFLAALLIGGAAGATVERYAVIVGNDVGRGDEITLRYAEKDATRVYDVLKDLGGFRPEMMVLLRREDAATIRRALIAMNDRIRAAPAGTEVVLLVYYSGHADAGALHLGDSQLDLAELEQLVRGSAATVRLLIVDSCRSGALTRGKGGRSAPPVPISVEERLAGEGAVVLAATSATEDAQESDEIQGSFFTHALVSGLLGAADSDGDGRVTLEEAYRYAYDATLRASSRTLAGAQHPSFRYDLRGQGELTLTRLGADLRRRGVLSLPPGRTWLVLAGSSDGAVVAEVGADDRSRRIDLSEGLYFVRGRGRDFLVEGQVKVPAGAERAVDETSLRRTEYARLVRKGEASAWAAHGPQVGYRFRTGIVAGSSLCHGGYVAYPVELRQLTLSPRVGYCRAGFDNGVLSTVLESLDGELGLTHAFDVPLVTFELGIAVGGAWLHEAFTTAGRAPSRSSGGLTVAATVAMSAELGRGLYVVLEAAAQTYFFDQVTESGVSFGPAFAFRGSIGLGEHF